jgi:DNA repair exonuclease SbcCD ATPase subunit
MIDSFDAALEANRSRREPLRARYEALFAEIASKKKIWASSPPARRKILELELRALLSEYQGLERQLTAYFENERTLVTVRTRVEEIVALEMRKVSERQIDRLTDKLDDAVEDAEDANGAISDLEKAGARREGDSASLEEALAGFDLDDPASAGIPDAPAAVPAADVAAAPAAPMASSTAPVPDISDLLP